MSVWSESSGSVPVMELRNSSSPVLSQLLQSSEYSDFTLVCQGQEFHLHKNVVCVQSPMISAALRGDFKESKTNIVNADQFDPLIMQCVVDFWYKENYRPHRPTTVKKEHRRTENQTQPAKSEVKKSKKNSSVPKIEIESYLHHVRVNAAADYYQVTKLKELSRAKLQHLLRSHWHLEMFPTLVQTIHGMTGDEEVYNLLALFAVRHMNELTELPEVAELDWGSEFTLRVLRSCGRNMSLLSSGLRKSHDDCARQAQMLDNIDRCKQTMEKLTNCPNCDRELLSMLEKTNCGHAYHIRCRGCQDLLPN
ncbi:hypothetical protein V2G26_012971 [Clonostachys chloroleuca]